MIGAIGGCLFLIAFFIHNEEGVGSAIGLLGIGIAICAMILNLLLEILSEKTTSKHRRHQLIQAMFACLIATGVFALAGYVFHYGTLPSFMPERYHEKYHFRPFGELSKPAASDQVEHHC